MKKELSPKQLKIAEATEPKDKITGSDFKALKSSMAEGGIFEPRGQKPFQVKKQMSRIR